MHNHEAKLTENSIHLLMFKYKSRFIIYNFLLNRSFILKSISNLLICLTISQDSVRLFFAALINFFQL